MWTFLEVMGHQGQQQSPFDRGHTIQWCVYLFTCATRFYHSYYALVSVSICHMPLLHRKLGVGSSWFLAHKISLTSIFRKLGESPKIWVVLSGTSTQTLYMEKFYHGTSTVAWWDKHAIAVDLLLTTSGDDSGHGQVPSTVITLSVQFWVQRNGCMDPSASVNTCQSRVSYVLKLADFNLTYQRLAPSMA